MSGIFVSYRRDDVAGQVGRLFGRLAAHYGEDFIFMDVESINPSQQFESVIQNRIKDCDVMLLAIGPHWQAERTASKDSKDFIRMELGAAIAAKRPLCPLLVDRREPPVSAGLPDEFQQVLSSQAIEIRHSTFDRDVDALIAGLERQGVRPPPSFGRQRVEGALIAAGWPFSWFGAMSRLLSPPGAAALAVILLAAVGWLVYQSGYGYGVVAGDALGRQAMEKDVEELTKSYEGQIGKERRENLRIFGLVTDGTKGVPAAKVTLTNKRNNLTVSEETDSRGVYNVDLESLKISANDVVYVEVTEPSYKPTKENVKYHDGFREFRLLVLRK